MCSELILTSLLQGLILTFVAYGVMIPFRLLTFPDLTAEGAYPLGGAVCASVILAGGHPVIAVILAAIAAGVIGVGTAFICLRFQVNTLLAGIILSTMLYSINLKIMRKPNIALFDQQILFTNYNTLTKVIVLFVIVILLVAPMILFFRTELGLKLRAVGLNPGFAKRQGISVAKYTILGLFMANCYTGFAGSIMVQIQNYMDIGMGIGIVIHALAALMIGESVIGSSSLNKQLLSPLVGALIYQQLQGLALYIGLAPGDLKFFTGSIVLSIIALRNLGHSADK